MDEDTTAKIKEFLGTKVLKKSEFRFSGCISTGEGFYTDSGLVFIKKNKSEYAEAMFNSEIVSLNALEKTKTIRVPHPIGVIKGPKDNTFYCIFEFVEIFSLSKYTAMLGQQLARLHLHNEYTAKNSSNFDYVKQFGFPITTCVGKLPVNNTWCDDWPTFYTRRLEEQIERTKNEEMAKLWYKLKPMIPRFFENIEVKPSLLHGDLWGGNAGETKTEPIIFDPGSVYGHHEFDLAMTTVFGRFGREFYESYYKLIPKERGYTARENLYHLFHFLNHWNHFGIQYEKQSFSTMRLILKTKFPFN